MRVGVMMEHQTGNGEIVWRGSVNTLRRSFKFQLAKNPNAGRAEGSPQHLCVSRSPSGEPVEIGVAWESKIGRGDSAGRIMFQFSFDDPDWPEPFRLAAFPEPSPSAAYEIVFNRPRQGGASGNGEQAPPL